MPGIKEISEMSLRALQAAEDVRVRLSSKIASQEAEISRLRSLQNGAEQFRALVAKLASAGVVDRPNAKYLDTNVTDEKVGEFIQKLANVIDVPEQKASVSPYEVAGSSEGVTVTDMAAADCDRKIRAIIGR